MQRRQTIAFSIVATSFASQGFTKAATPPSISFGDVEDAQAFGLNEWIRGLRLDADHASPSILGDVQRSFGVRITRATTINPFAGLGAGRQFPDAGQPSIALRCYEPWTVSERSFFARVPPSLRGFQGSGTGVRDERR